MEASGSAQQTEIDADEAKVAAIGPKIKTIVDAFDALKTQMAQGQAPNLANLEAAIDSLNTQADAGDTDVAQQAQPVQPDPNAPPASA